MANNVIREQQLQSVASAAKDFALANANILNSVPATVNGGLWYELENDTPVIKLYYGGHSYFLTPTLDSIQTNFTLWDENDQYVGTVPESSVTLLTVAQADSLNEDDESYFLAARDDAILEAENSNLIFTEFKWIDIPEEYKDETWFWMRYEFSANTEADASEILCTVNGNPMEVVEVSAGEFYAKLTEFGALAILIPQS